MGRRYLVPKSHQSSSRNPSSLKRHPRVSTALLPSHLPPLHRPTLLDSLIDDHPRRKAQPAPPIPPDPKTTPCIRAIEIAIPLAVHTWRRAPRRDPRRALQGLPMLLHQLPRHDTKDLLDALARLRTDLMATVPADVLTPEATAALTARAARAVQRQAVRSQKVTVAREGGGALARRDAAGRRGRGRRGRERRVQVLGDVGDAALEGHGAAGGVLGDEVGLGADDVQDDGLAELLAQVGQPAAHVAEAVLVGDAVAQDAGVGAAVVEARDGAEALLAGRVPDLEAHDRVSVGVEDPLGQEGGADRGGRVRLWPEGAVDVAVDERRLAHALGAEDDDLGFEGAHGVVWCMCDGQKVGGRPVASPLDVKLLLWAWGAVG